MAGLITVVGRVVLAFVDILNSEGEIVISDDNKVF